MELESSPAQDGNSEIRSGSFHALEATFLELRQETREGSGIAITRGGGG